MENLISGKTGVKTVNIVLLRKKLVSPNINSLQYMTFAMNAMKIIKKPNQTQPKNPRAQQG